ncbi:MAG: copper transporter [Gaiellaceae bacterium MAG52_C11]|nr:copper transporter [Candidatus Gaiellasilicea maunaloa]
MLDFRYHAISLAAVFLALVIGILAGVGISGRGFVDDAERDRFNRQISGLEGRIDAAEERADELERRQAAAQTFVESAYPVLADRRLEGANVAVLVVGSVDTTLEWVRRALERSGGDLVRMRAVNVPVVSEELDRSLSSAFGGYVGEDELDNLGHDLGLELAEGGETPLWDLLTPDLVGQREGDFDTPADALVLIRQSEPQQGDTARFLAGLYSGLAGSGEPVVGVELSRVLQSAIPAFQRSGLSTVDGVDTPLGGLALILLLGGAGPGDYGIRDTAEDGILPPIEPLPAAVAGE